MGPEATLPVPDFFGSTLMTTGTKISLRGIRTKSVWTKRERRDGLRLLVTRYVPRGCPRERYEVWMPNLGPSEPLLHDFLGKRISWNEFARRYQRELFEPAPMDRRNARTKNHGQKFTLRLIKALALRQPVTLLCHCAEDAEYCHRFLLKRTIESAKV
jgi:uncharacterized protein YeaO (DUF488 family)